MPKTKHERHRSDESDKIEKREKTKSPRKQFRTLATDLSDSDMKSGRRRSRTIHSSREDLDIPITSPKLISKLRYEMEKHVEVFVPHLFFCSEKNLIEVSSASLIDSDIEESSSTFEDSDDMVIATPKKPTRVKSTKRVVRKSSSKARMSKKSSRNDSSSSLPKSPSSPSASPSPPMSTEALDLPDLTKVKVSEEELKKKLVIKEELGKGAFSLVMKATRSSDSVDVAVKIVDLTRLTPKQLAELDAERFILEQFRHPHVVNLLAIYETTTRLYLVLELLSAGDLFNKILQKGCFSERATKRITLQLTSAVAAMHKLGIVHRDLKPENILCIEDPVTKQIDVKVADFGIAKKLGKQRTKSTCGSPGYVAPEVIRGDEYDLAVDMFSLGAIVYVMLAGYPPFWGDDMKTILSKNLNVEFSYADMYWAHISQNAKDFINQLIVLDPEERMTSEQALKHPWLASKK